MSGSLRALLVVFGLLLAAGLALDLAVLVLLAGVGMLVVVVTAWIEAEVSALSAALRDRVTEAHRRTQEACERLFDLHGGPR